MFKNNKGYLVYLGVVVIFLLSLATVYGMFGRGLTFYKPLVAKGEVKTVKPTVKAETVIKKEIRYLCGDRVSTRIPTTSDLIGLEFTSLVRKYPPERGWAIDDSVKNTLVLVRSEKQVCPYHQDFRHLGISDGNLAVYEGTLGYDQKVLLREDIAVSELPFELQTDLRTSMDYNNQSPDTQGRLKAMYEFETEGQLNSVLENFDEFKE
jgi:hypothetical protein